MKKVAKETLVSPLDAIASVIEEAKAKVCFRLSRAFYAMVSEVDVTMVERSGLTIYVQQMGFSDLRLSGTVSIDLAPTAWRQKFEPAKSPHKCDHIASAGRYVLDGIVVTSSVSLPAVNRKTGDLLAQMREIELFTSIVHNGEVYLRDLLQRATMEIGARYLQEEYTPLEE